MEGSGMKLRNELKAGIFVLSSLFIIAGLILIMGRERQIFAKQSEFQGFHDRRLDLFWTHWLSAASRGVV